MREYILGFACVALLSSCTSCCKKKEIREEVRTVEDYSDFELADEDKQPITPDTETTYDVKMRVVHRTYLL